MASHKTEPILEKPNPASVEEHAGSETTITRLVKVIPRGREFSSFAIIGLFVLGLIAFLYYAKPFLLPMVLALLISFPLKPAVHGLKRLRIPQALGAALVVALFLGAITTGITRLAEPVADWVAKVPDSLRVIERKAGLLLQPWTGALETGTGSPPASPDQPKVEHKPFNLVDTIQSYMTGLLTGLSYTTTFLTGALETVVLLFFLLATGDVFLQKLIRLVLTLQDKKEAQEIAQEVQHNISTFLLTVTIINTCLGVLVGFATLLLGMPNPLLWGILAGLLNFIPYFGPLTGVTVLTLAGLLTFESLGRGLAPPLVYLALHGLESNFITPMILGRRLTLNPVIILVSLAFWTWLWGIPGAFLSVPLLMMVKILCEHFKPLEPLAEFLGG